MPSLVAHNDPSPGSKTVAAFRVGAVARHQDRQSAQGEAQPRGGARRHRRGRRQAHQDGRDAAARARPGRRGGGCRGREPGAAPAAHARRRAHDARLSSDRGGAAPRGAPRRSLPWRTLRWGRPCKTWCEAKQQSSSTAQCQPASETSEKMARWYPTGMRACVHAWKNFGTQCSTNF